MSRDLCVGALVHWEESPGAEHGIVTEVVANRIIVRMDDGEERQFARREPPIRRVLREGQQVRCLSTDEIGFVSEPTSSTETGPRWKVTFINLARRPVVKTVPESDLRPDLPVEPVERLRSGHTGKPRQCRLALVTRHYSIEHRQNDLVSLSDARVDLKPHQVSVAHRVISNYPHRFLLCDEVGLGKTIEAGMILKELRARKEARRTLIIVPPNLLRQWQFELKTKFNEVFSILNTQTVQYLKDSGVDGNPFLHSDSVLVSSSWVTRKKWSELCVEVDWDLIIVDEAHHARHTTSNRAGTQLYQLVRELADPDHYSSRGLLFLTATPMQLNTHELYSLIEMLDPALFPTEDRFDENRRDMPGLNRLVEELRKHGFPIPGRNPDETIEQVGAWLGIDTKEATKKLEAGGEDLERIIEELAQQHLLSEIMIRNRKSVVGGFMPRRAQRWSVDLTEEELTALDAIEDYVQTGWDMAKRTKDQSIGFVMTIFQKMAASSIQAIRTSLAGRRERILGGTTKVSTVSSMSDKIEDDARATDVVAEARAITDEVARLDKLIELLDNVHTDSKAREMQRGLGEIFDEDPNAKVIIFTEFRETQEYLASLFREMGWNVNLFHGQLKPLEKDRAVDRFREGTGPQILLSTEAGGEGRNFQFCHILVNYDLPWNPMRVEQRIGRVDRIGQDHVVQIFNLWVKGTIEERVLEVLESRINIFEDTVGGLDPILGDTEKDIKAALQLGRRDRDKALQKLEERLERDVRDARVAEEKLRDFIMETKSYSREIAERIIGQTTPIGVNEQEQLITHLLKDVNMYIGEMERGEREIVFHEPFVSDYPEHVKSGKRRRVVFRPEQRTDSENVEYMAFGHPVVDDLVERVLAPDYGGSAGSRRMLADEKLQPCAGWLFTYVLTVPGIRMLEELAPVFVGDDGDVSLERGWQVVHRSCGSSRGEKAVEDIPLDDLDEVDRSAERVASARLSEMECKAREIAEERTDRELRKLEEWFEYRQRAARDRMDSTQATLERLRAEMDDERRKIIPVWEANLERDRCLIDELSEEKARRLGEIEHRRNPAGAMELVQAIRLEVVEG